MKIIHMLPPADSEVEVKETGVDRNADARADKVHSKYLTTRRANSMWNASHRRPTWRHGPSSGSSNRTHKSGGNAWAPLRSAARTSICCYGRRQGPRPCATGAILRSRAASVEAAVATYSARYRRHWGSELALQGARLRFSRAYLAFHAPSRHAGTNLGPRLCCGLQPGSQCTVCG